MTQKDLDLNDPSLYINRELSWLEFNARVMEEGLSSAVPPMERLKFLAIVGFNLDEFFMIRVAGLKQQVKSGVRARDASGLRPEEQLQAIHAHLRQSQARRSEGIRQALELLRAQGLDVAEPGELTPPQLSHVESYFTQNILPVLTPLAAEELVPFPTLPGKALNVGVVLESPAGSEKKFVLAAVPIPQSLPRFVTVPAGKTTRLTPVEEVVRKHIGKVFQGMKILATSIFRLTRDADVPVDDESARDLLIVMEAAVRSRRRRDVVRLEIAAGADERLREWLASLCQVPENEVCHVEGMLDPSSLMTLVNQGGYDALRDAPWPPQPPRDILNAPSLWEAVDDHDVLLFHPYESFDPVLHLLQTAAEDPKVLAIKQTLYRTDGESRIIDALARAAENGKQVTVVVELKARFDEAHNVAWARRLEDAGCQVLYGIAGYKTHGKIILILRQGPNGIRRYMHLATGNYHERTARQYVDLGFITSARDYTSDGAAFFNLLTGYSQEVGWNRFAVAPLGLRRKFLELIEREAQISTPAAPGLIMAKMNSLEDPEICRALYQASRAGVRIQLNVRGICCLRPGLNGVSDNIEVISIVDRFLEHARMYYFQNGGREEVYLSSADWMKRNLDGRFEILAPISGMEHRRRLTGIFQTYFADNVKARRLMSDGRYVRVTGGSPIRAQEVFYRAAVDSAQQPPARFHPLARPEEQAR